MSENVEVVSVENVGGSVVKDIVLSDEQLAGIRSAGYEVAKIEGSKVFIHDVMFPGLKEMPFEIIADALSALAGEVGSRYRPDGFGRKVGKKAGNVQAWRVEEEKRRLARIRK